MPNGDNPKYVVISLFINEMNDKQIICSSNISNPTVYDLNKITKGRNEKDATANVLSIIKEHVKKYGTLDELVIEGHGSKEKMSSGKTELNNIDIENILYHLLDLEKELGKKITNRTVFSGCSTFFELKNDEIRVYREFAKEHKIQIVGSTSTTRSGEGYSIGRFVQFTTEGRVIRDKLDTRYNLYALENNDTSWIDNHLGKTQEEIEKESRKELIEEASKLIQFKGIVPAGVEKQIRNKIDDKDALAEKTDVLLTKDGKGAIIICSDGTIHTRGKVKLHTLTESEKFDAILKIGDLSDELKGKSIERIKKGYENSEKAMNPQPLDKNIDLVLQRKFSDNPDEINFRVVVLDGDKRVLLVTENGGYEYIDIFHKEKTENEYRYSGQPDIKPKNPIQK